MGFLHPAKRPSDIAPPTLQCYLGENSSRVPLGTGFVPSPNGETAMLAGGTEFVSKMKDVTKGDYGFIRLY